MEKRTYIKPVLESETFVPQNYIAACGDQNKVYLFTCDGGGGEHGGVWQNTNGLAGLQTDWTNTGTRWRPNWVKPDKQITWSESSYHACNITHEAKTTDDFIEDCFFKGSRSGNIIPVTVWRGPDGDNVHCTKKLGMSSWETVKS